MSESKQYRKLTDSEITVLQERGCTAANWSDVHVTENFNLSTVKNAAFRGVVKIGLLSGNVTDANGYDKSSGIYNALVKDCTIGDNCRISSIADQISGYNIENDVCIESSGTVTAKQDSSFGSGTQVNVLNEAGGRQVTLLDNLSAQFAYMLSLHKYRPALIEKLNAIADKSVQSAKAKPAVISAGAKISFAREIVDVTVGPSTVIRGASSLVNGTILSDPKSPTFVGADVSAKNFIIAEYASVDSGANIENVFVGQGCRVAKFFAAEHSLFFANSELYGGEACSVFAGPYTVTHHKSSLLIAGLLSFFNAGSGANQSNHMYRLGPVHEGKLLRGTKTGSFTYMLWPSVTAPFSAVHGKHGQSFDSSSFPFSIIKSSGEQTFIVPAVQLKSSGTLRDGIKWPNRDKRGNDKRDAITFDVMSPYTVSMMIDGCEKLKNLIAESSPTTKNLQVNYAMIKKSRAAKGIEIYNKNIELYLLEKMLKYLAEKSDTSNGVYSYNWVDLAGLLIPKARLESLWEKIETGRIDSVESFNAEIAEIHGLHAEDECVWVEQTCKEVLEIDMQSLSESEFEKLSDRYKELKTEFLNDILADAGKEFSQKCKAGYGLDGSEGDLQEDFNGVRGLLDDNEFVKELRKSIDSL